MNAYTPGIERMMKRLFDSLREHDRRRYAAIEATKVTVQSLIGMGNGWAYGGNTGALGIQSSASSEHPCRLVETA